jgi:hypothetical protein
MDWFSTLVEVYSFRIEVYCAVKTFSPNTERESLERSEQVIEN